MQIEKGENVDIMRFEKRPGTDIVPAEIFGLPAQILIDSKNEQMLEAFVNYPDGMERKFVFDPESGRLSSVSTRRPDGTLTWEDSEALLKTYGQFADKISIGTDIMFRKNTDRALHTEYGGKPLPPRSAFETETLREITDPDIPPQ